MEASQSSSTAAGGDLQHAGLSSLLAATAQHAQADLGGAGAAATGGAGAKRPLSFADGTDGAIDLGQFGAGLSDVALGKRRRVDGELDMGLGVAQQQQLQPLDVRDGIRAFIRNCVVEPHPVEDSDEQEEGVRPFGISSVLCLHASVVQKSYGKEKRFFTPPPVAYVAGPLARQLGAPLVLSLACLRTSGLQLSNNPAHPMPGYDAPLLEILRRNKGELKSGNGEEREEKDKSLLASFKALHVGRPAGSEAPTDEERAAQNAEKQFELALSVSSQGSGLLGSFKSDPLAIISKPSKKTAKARNTDSCIFSDSKVSFFNRINSQTVRTKYLAFDDHDDSIAAGGTPMLKAKMASWDAFQVVVAPSSSASTLTDETATERHMITYGTEIILRCVLTGRKTERLIARRVEKTYVHPKSDGGPLSQLQKVALETLVDGKPSGLFLSTRSGDPLGGTSEDGGEQPPLQSAPGVNTDIALTYRPAIEVDPDKGKKLDDFAMWTLTGISSFEYAFWDALGPLRPSDPITPFPTLSGLPQIAESTPAWQELRLAVKGYYPSSQQQGPESGPRKGLEVWAGEFGPLEVVEEVAVANDANASSSAMPALVDHAETSVLVKLPLIKTLLDSVANFAKDRSKAFIDPGKSVAAGETLEMFVNAIRDPSPPPSFVQPALQPVGTAVDPYAPLPVGLNFRQAAPPPFLTSSSVPPMSSATTSTTYGLPSMPFAQPEGRIDPALYAYGDISVDNYQSLLNGNGGQLLPQATPVNATPAAPAAARPKRQPTSPLPPPAIMAPVPLPANCKAVARFPIMFVRASDGIGFMTGRWVLLAREGSKVTTDNGVDKSTYRLVVG